MNYDSIIEIDCLPVDLINDLYSNKKVSISSLNLEETYPYQKLILKSDTSSALGVVSRTKEEVQLVENISVFGVTARNKEQNYLLRLLQDNHIKLHVIVGKAGSGKTTCAYAYAMKALLDDKSFKKIVFTKPTYSVDAGPSLGALPGELKEKYHPLLINYQHIGDELGVTEYLGHTDKIEFIPIQMMRGASFINTLVIADEVQSLTVDAMKTLCTRIGKGSKLILLGDIKQRDRKSLIQDTGLFKLLTSEQVKHSPLCSVSELIKCERSELVELMEKVFE